MQIRNKLTFQFVLVVAFILVLFSLAIYYFSADYREEDFYTRLRNKAINTSKLLIEVEEVDAGLLKKIETNNPASLPKERILIFNYKNEELFRTHGAEELIITPALLDKIRLSDEIRFRQGEFEVLGFLFTDKYDRFVVIAGAVDIFGLKKLQNLRLVIFIVFGISIGVVFLVGWIYAGRALHPISSVVEQVDNISISSLDLRVDEGNQKDEIAKLAQTFNKMLERLEKAFKVQKNFIANASHELRTPLTIITGQLEVALMSDRSKEAYQEAMRSALQDMKMLNTISNRLLLLAQTNSESLEFDPTPIRIDDVIWQVRTELMKRYPGFEVSVLIDTGIENEDELTIQGNEQLIKSALTNLMENGYKYSKGQAIEVSLETKDQQICLRFKDKGIGIEPSDLNQIFEPFYRGKNTTNIKGHGIGLSLVERIVKLHQGRISVESQVNQGTTFILLLPTI